MNTPLRPFTLASSFALLIAAAPAFSQAPEHDHEHPNVGGVTSATTTMVNGEVRKVDKEQGKITLRHEPIPNLEMPSMTMVFRVKDAALLDRVKQGDKVKFAADLVDGQLTVVAIAPSN